MQVGKVVNVFERGNVWSSRCYWLRWFRTFVALMEWPMRLLQKKSSHVFCVGENGRSLVLLERQRQSA